MPSRSRAIFWPKYNKIKNNSFFFSPNMNFPLSISISISISIYPYLNRILWTKYMYNFLYCLLPFRFAKTQKSHDVDFMEPHVWRFDLPFVFSSFCVKRLPYKTYKVIFIYSTILILLVCIYIYIIFIFLKKFWDINSNNKIANNEIRGSVWLLVARVIHNKSCVQMKSYGEWDFGPRLCGPSPYDFSGRL